MRVKKFTLITVAIMAFIFFQSALNADMSKAESGVIVELILRVFQDLLHVSRDTVVFAVRKGAHFTEYMILGCSLVPTVREWMPSDGTESGKGHKKTHVGQKVFLPAWVIGTLYAVTDEIHQYFVPGRSCELRDMTIDSCGVLVGAALVTLLIRWRSGEGRSQ